MNRIFRPDNPVMILINKIVICVYLNFLWLLFSLPLVTVGASTTALFYVTLKLAKNEEGRVTQQFLSAFRENFRQATCVWLILASVGLLMAADGYVLYHLWADGPFWTLLTAILIVAAAALVMILLYIFPLMAHFSNTIPAMLRNSLMIGMRFLLCTVLMAGIYAAMAYVVICVFTPAIVFGEGLCAYLCSCLLSGIIKQCEEKTKEHAGAECQENAD